MEETSGCNEMNPWRFFSKVDDVAIMPAVDAAPNVATMGMNIVWGAQRWKKHAPKNDINLLRKYSGYDINPKHHGISSVWYFTEIQTNPAKNRVKPQLILRERTKWTCLQLWIADVEVFFVCVVDEFHQGNKMIRWWFHGFCFTSTMDEVIYFDSLTNIFPFENTNWKKMSLSLRNKTERNTGGKSISDVPGS